MTPGLYPKPLRIVLSKDLPREASTTSQPKSGLKMHLSPTLSIRQMGKPSVRAGNWPQASRMPCSCSVASRSAGLAGMLHWLRP